jgi:hypothetical protein
MLYKTIVLEFLQQLPQTYDQLLKNRTLLPTLNLYAIELRDRHEAWKDRLSRTEPLSNPSQIASQALEPALQELEASLLSKFLPDENEPPFVEAAMAFLRDHTPPA